MSRKYETNDFHVEWRPRVKIKWMMRHSMWRGYLVTVWAPEADFNTGECFTEAVEAFASWAKARAFIMSYGIDKGTAEAMRPASSIRRK